ncbi:hypothetical protein [Streptomyces sp. NPDC014623]|uniref:hypothetical protein n=1 Tax=Streptomyces sp. NPDC014623 TaxID=3364875 RepID=UPI0036FF8065
MPLGFSGRRNTPAEGGATDFESRKGRKPQGRKKLTRERAACLQLMQRGCSGKEACRGVGTDVRTGKK